MKDLTQKLKILKTIFLDSTTASALNYNINQCYYFHAKEMIEKKEIDAAMKEQFGGIELHSIFKKRGIVINPKSTPNLHKYVRECYSNTKNNVRSKNYCKSFQLILDALASQREGEYALVPVIVTKLKSVSINIIEGDVIELNFIGENNESCKRKMSQQLVFMVTNEHKPLLVSVFKDLCDNIIQMESHIHLDFQYPTQVNNTHHRFNQFAAMFVTQMFSITMQNKFPKYELNVDKTQYPEPNNFLDRNVQLWYTMPTKNF